MHLEMRGCKLCEAVPTAIQQAGAVSIVQCQTDPALFVLSIHYSISAWLTRPILMNRTPPISHHRARSHSISIHFLHFLDPPFIPLFILPLPRPELLTTLPLERKETTSTPLITGRPIPRLAFFNAHSIKRIPRCSFIAYDTMLSPFGRPQFCRAFFLGLPCRRSAIGRAEPILSYVVSDPVVLPVLDKLQRQRSGYLLMNSKHPLPQLSLSI